MSDIQDEAYSEAMDEISKLKAKAEWTWKQQQRDASIMLDLHAEIADLKRRIATRDAELANAAKVFERMQKEIDSLKERLK